MIGSIRSRIAFAVLVVVAGSAALIIAISYTGNNNCCNPAGSNTGSTKRIIGYEYVYNYSNNSDTLVFRYVTTQDTLGRSGSIRFLTPFGASMSTFYQQNADTMSGNGDPNGVLTAQQKEAMLKDADAYEQYILVRLPPELAASIQNNSGNNNGNISAFRAYSVLDPGSKCLLGYRNDQGPDAARLDDPCHSDVFRASDGYSCYGHIAADTNPLVSGYNALPRMRISIDSQGYIVAIKPDGATFGDGTVGEGRMLSDDIIKATNSIDSTCRPFEGYQK